MRILAINPGGTSTRISVSEDENLFFRRVIEHPDQEINQFEKVFDEIEYRMEKIKKTLEENEIRLESLDCVAGRGGLLKPIQGGTYQVNPIMIEDVKNAINGEHPSNLGCVLAGEVGKQMGIPAVVVDPVSVDEFDEIARITGMKELEKASWLHALNQKAVSRRTAKKLGVEYDQKNFIVCHLGSGISIAAHKNGKMIDGGGGRTDGPFSPERSGALPVYPLVKLCFSGKYTYEEMVEKISKTGGFYDYLGTKDLRQVEQRIELGDVKAEAVMEAFIRQVAKEIGAYATVLEGKVERIIITGSIANSKKIMEGIRQKVEFIAPLEIIPGELEMEALTEGALRILNGTEALKVYK